MMLGVQQDIAYLLSSKNPLWQQISSKISSQIISLFVAVLDGGPGGGGGL